MGIKIDEGKWCYMFSTGVCYRRLVMLQDGIQVDFEGENDVLRIWIGGWKLKQMEGGWFEPLTRLKTFQRHVLH